jgi:hypothetical protein
MGIWPIAKLHTMMRRFLMRRWILGSVAALMLVLMTISSVRAGETLKDHSLSDGGTIMSESMADHQLNGGGTGRVEAGIALFWEGYGKTHVQDFRFD